MANEPPEIIFEHRPDATERAFRIGCGSLVGIMFAVILGFQFWPTAMGFLVLGAVLVILCSWLALRRGDAFFHKAMKWLPWV